MSAPVRSMTGFARARRPLGDGEVMVSAKSVNHRGLDIHIYSPASADPFENAIRGMLKQRLRRGHVDVRIVLPDASQIGGGAKINAELLESYMAEFHAMAAKYDLDEAPMLHQAMRVPGMFGDQGPADLPAGTEQAVLEALDAALTELIAFREREGASIREEMRHHNQVVFTAAEHIEKLRVGAAPAFQARLEQRLAELLDGVQIEPQRLAQEAAILADRSDIGEELARLKIHTGQFAVLLDEGGEVGKKLEFLLQEMQRETNTILSKTNGVGEMGLKITEQGLAGKSAIEKLREQCLNLE